MFAIMPRSVQRGFVGLSRSSTKSSYGGTSPSIRPYTMLALNLVSQLICVAGVNQLSSVSTLFFGARSPSALPSCCAARYNKTIKRPTDRSLTPFLHSSTGFYLFAHFLVESIRGVNSGRTHGTQGHQLVFQRMVVRQWLERGARSGGRYGVYRIVLVFGPASPRAAGPKGSAGEEKLRYQFIFPPLEAGKIFLVRVPLVIVNMTPDLGATNPIAKDQSSLHSHESGH
jgi:hypothetical protein